MTVEETSTETKIEWEALAGTILDGGCELRQVLETRGNVATLRARILGSGGRMGTAYLLQADPATADDQLDIWYTLQEIRHPNLSRPLSVGRLELNGIDTVYCVLPDPDEQLVGVIPERPLEWEEAAEVLHSAEKGLAHLHAYGLAHGSVSPETIEAVGYTILISTEGVRRIGRKPIFQWNPPRYLAPESKGVNTTTEADVWCLGASLFEVLAQERFGVPGAELERGLPLGAVIARCLDNNPVTRCTLKEAPGLEEPPPVVEEAPAVVETPAPAVIETPAPEPEPVVVAPITVAPVVEEPVAVVAEAIAVAPVPVEPVAPTQPVSVEPPVVEAPLPEVQVVKPEAVEAQVVEAQVAEVVVEVLAPEPVAPAPIVAPEPVVPEPVAIEPLIVPGPPTVLPLHARERVTDAKPSQPESKVPAPAAPAAPPKVEAKIEVQVEARPEIKPEALAETKTRDPIAASPAAELPRPTVVVRPAAPRVPSTPSAYGTRRPTIDKSKSQLPPPLRATARTVSKEDMQLVPVSKRQKGVRGKKQPIDARIKALDRAGREGEYDYGSPFAGSGRELGVGKKSMGRGIAAGVAAAAALGLLLWLVVIPRFQSAPDTASAGEPVQTQSSATPPPPPSVAAQTAPSTTPVPAADGSTAGPGAGFRVVLYSFETQTDATRGMVSVAEQHPDVPVHVFAPRQGGRYLVVAGGLMTLDEANSLRERIVAEGLPRSIRVESFRE